MTLWNGVLWLHLLAMAFFVGGQLMLAFVVVPAMRGVEDRAPLLTAAKRFGIGTGVALLVLIATGVATATHLQRWHDSTLQAKLGLVVVVMLLIGAHAKWSQWRWLDGLIFLVSIAIVWLGIAVAG